MSPSMCCTAGPARTGRCKACLEILGIPYSHSGVLASAVAMHKGYAKAMFRAAGIPVAEDLMASRFEAAERHLMTPPYVVKPMAEGSSVGVFIVTEAASASAARAVIVTIGRLAITVLIERYIPGKELTCAVLGDRALDVIEIVPATEFLRLRGEIRRGRFQTRSAGANFTKCLPGSPQIHVWLPMTRLAAAA